jgi:DNA-binding IscR family transcriptional regulator
MRLKSFTDYGLRVLMRLLQCDVTGLFQPTMEPRAISINAVVRVHEARPGLGKCSQNALDDCTLQLGYRTNGQLPNARDAFLAEPESSTLVDYTYTPRAAVSTA